ncbi:hypothetical protein [Mesorhizobium australicum]|nr:hypothetical protein [Mesorhizobium australicum]
MLISYIPLILGEALVIGFACGFLSRVKPDAFWCTRTGTAYA